MNCPTTVTDSTGFYRFTGLATGSYRVQVRTATLPGAGAVQTGDPDQLGVLCTTCDNQNTAALGRSTLANGNAADDDFTNNNFGYSSATSSSAPCGRTTTATACRTRASRRSPASPST